jgi:hypothetical protein
MVIPRKRKVSSMVSTALEFLDILSWKFHRILNEEGISELHWAFMQRAVLDSKGVRFNAIMAETGEPKDNVRRAASFLQENKVGKVSPDSRDNRARIFKLSELGRRRTEHIMNVFKEELLASVGAREIFSNRARLFTRHMGNASCYLASGDLAGKNLKDRRRSNREEIPDDSLRFVGSSKRPRVLFKPKQPETLPF